MGGIRTFIRYVYRNFDASKWHFTIVAPDFEETKVLLDDLSGQDIDYVPVFGIPTDGSSGFSKMFRCVVLQLFKKRFDLIHSHGFTSGICTALPAFICRTPHLMTSHDVINDNQFSGWKGKAKKLVIGRLLSIIDTIHSVSYDAQANLLTHFSFLDNRVGKCIVISNGIEIDRFIEAEPRDLRGELCLGEDVFFIGFMGRFMAQKGFRYLVDAIELLLRNYNPEKRPLVLTFGHGAFIREEKEAINKRGLNEFFCFMPFTPNVAGSIRGLDVVVMPSLWEACSLLAMEVLICGVPLIGSDCTGLREVLQGTPAKVIPKADAVALAKSIKQEMERSSKATFLNYRKAASERFDARKTIKAILDLYERMED